MNQEIKQKKSGNVAVILLILGLIIIGGVAGYFYFSKNDKNVLKTYITESANYLENNVLNTLDSSGKINLSFNLESENEDIKETADLLNKIKLDTSYQVDYTNKKMYMELNSTYDSKELLKGNIYADNGYLYFNIDNITDKYYKSDELEEYDELFNLNKELNINDLKNGIEELRDRIINNLDKANIEEEDVTLNNKKVVKTSLTMTEEFIKILTDELEEIDENKIKDLENLKLILYTDNNDFVKLEIIKDTTNITIDKNNNTYTITINADSIEQIKFDLTIKDDNNMNIVLYLNEEELSGNVNIDITKTTFNKIQDIDISNATSLNDLSEEEMSKMFEKISENEGVMALLKELEKFSAL